jgi:cytochrome c
MMFHRIRFVMFGAAILAVGTVHAEEGSAEAGKEVFKKCAVCHSPDAGVNKLGPSLHGIVGRHAASVWNFNIPPHKMERRTRS